MKPYFLALFLNMKDPFRYKRGGGVFIVRALSLCAMILIFFNFWIVLKSGSAFVIDPLSFLSYLTVGASLQFSRPEGRIKEIEDEIRTGNIAYRMARPINFVLLNFCEILGIYLIRLPLLLCIGFGMIYLVTNQLPPIGIFQLPILLGLLLFSASFASLCMVFIGLSALYFYDSLPFYWIVQKCEYVLGGLFFPIIFYPEWFQKICLLTPFGWTGYSIASLTYNFSYERAGEIFLFVLGWNIFIGIILNLLYKSIQRKVCVYG